MTAEGAFSIISSFLSAARATNRVYGELVTGVDWTDIGTPEQLEALRGRINL
jgi:NDP-sugar pyrophosphorylase family protein